MSNPQTISTKKQTRKIKSRLWLVLAAATAPFLGLAVVIVISVPGTDTKLLVTAIFVLAFGLALLASKLASHTAINRYLNAIDEFDEARSDFINVASHQLKTPVASLGYTLEAFDDALEQEDEEQIAMLKKDLWHSADRLNKLTRNLLNVGRIESGTLEMDREEVDIGEQIEEVTSELEAIADENNVSVAKKVDIEDGTTVLIDKELLYNVLENLLTNAFEYAYEDTEGAIRAQRKTDNLEVSVTNVGDPLTEKQQEGLFEKFSSSSSDDDEDVGSAGLGLYIVKKYVEAWGGEIRVDADKDGTTTFAFTIPLDNEKDDEG